MKMLTQFLIVLLFFAVLAPVYGGGKGIRFEETAWSAIKAKAIQENKPIFFDAYASWCGPCKWLAANVFTDDKVAAFFNEKFINVHFDMEKGEGLELAKLYGVRVYPTLLFLTPQGEMMHRAAGSMPVENFLELAKTALNPEKNLAGMMKKFNAGNTTSQFAYEYFSSLSNLYVDYKTDLDAYTSKLTKNDFCSKDNWNILRDYLQDAESATFTRLMAEKDKLAQTLSKDTIDKKIASIYIDQLMKSVRMRKFSQKTYDSLRAEYVKAGYVKDSDLETTTDFIVAEKTKNWAVWTKTAAKIVATCKEPGELNRLAWTVFEKIDDKDAVLQAIEWSKKSIDITENSGLIDTYANLLFKSGNKAEAINQEKRAIARAKLEGTPIEEMEETLKQFQK
ncbi:MAG: thioredoxin family protein [Ignavibacteria bacterium]|nr:thioredoxin family protein [Ignavibacteria bacterium]